jgi:hypothetical protein
MTRSPGVIKEERKFSGREPITDPDRRVAVVNEFTLRRIDP